MTARRLPCTGQLSSHSPRRFIRHACPHVRQPLGSSLPRARSEASHPSVLQARIPIESALRSSKGPLPAHSPAGGCDEPGRSTHPCDRETARRHRHRSPGRRFTCRTAPTSPSRPTCRLFRPAAMRSAPASPSSSPTTHPIAKHTKPTGRSGDSVTSPEPDGTTIRPAYDSYSPHDTPRNPDSTTWPAASAAQDGTRPTGRLIPQKRVPVQRLFARSSINRENSESCSNHNEHRRIESSGLVLILRAIEILPAPHLVPVLVLARSTMYSSLS